MARRLTSNTVAQAIHGAARHAATASSENQTVRLPHARRAASYSAQFVTLYRCFGMRCRRSAFALNGNRGAPDRRRGRAPASAYLKAPRRPIPATTPRRASAPPAPGRKARLLRSESGKRRRISNQPRRRAALQLSAPDAGAIERDGVAGTSRTS